jgi:glycosyltransferase involved in cell wall biosynthesis
MSLLSFENQPADTIMPGMEAHLKKWVPESAKRADHIIADSEATRRDLITLYHTPPQKITTLYPGVSAKFQPITRPQTLAVVRQKYGLDEHPFILSVSTIQPRKNYRRLIRAFAKIDPPHRLVIAGGKGWGYDHVFAEVDKQGLQNRVHFPGYVDDADLPALYSAADLFAYPSLYEGFGLPILEAMACGTPVVAGNQSSLPEVVGQAGLLIDPYDVDALAVAMNNVLSDPARQQQLVEAGYKQAQQFTWDEMVTRLLKLYKKILEDGSR